MRPRQILLAPAVLVPALLMLTVGVAMAIAAMMIDDPDVPASALYQPEGSTTGSAAGASASPTPASVLVPSPPDARGPSEPILLAPPATIRIERLEVRAALVTLGIETSTGNMAAPDLPDEVGWYHFTGRPGAGTGNAVFAGHRDWGGIGPAVFFNLGDLVPGDLVEVELEDGSLVRYTVTAAHTYAVEGIDMREILARTDQETLTLITCAGQFADGDYTDRHVVRAVRTEVVPAAG